MAKPSIQNITVAQTFQNWLDRTNEIVDIVRDSAVTASISGTPDVTNGDATLVGDFTANNVTVFDDLKVDSVASNTPGAEINFASPVKITSSAQKIASTFAFAASGAQTRYTNNSLSWDIGIDNNIDFNFVINQGSGGQFELSPQGVLTVPSIVVTSDINFPLNANGQFTGELSVANATITDTLTANNATFTNATGGFFGTFTGDVYHPSPTGGNGAGKVLENGGPNAAVPATFFGNVNGTVSSITNHTTNTLTEGTDNRVGESAPGARDGGNNLYFTQLRARNSFTNGTGVTIGTTADSNGRYTISIGQPVTTDSNVLFRSVVCTGNVTAFFGTTSDARLKENVEQITSALDKVNQINGYTFNHKGNDERMAGVLAQELIEVLPEAVFETQDPKTGENIYAVRYDNIIGLLIEAIKELNQKVGN